MLKVTKFHIPSANDFGTVVGKPIGRGRGEVILGLQHQIRLR